MNIVKIGDEVMAHDVSGVVTDIEGAKLTLRTKRWPFIKVIDAGFVEVMKQAGVPGGALRRKLKAHARSR